ncbi:MAG: thioredoxin [Bacteroidales bacterium]|nr:thioredoxin [Bacteroidales bacterium]
MKKTIFFVVLALITSLTTVAQDAKNSSKVKHITYEDFIKEIWDFEKSPNEFVFKGSVPAVVDFYADWCGPCRMVGPIMEKMAEDYDEELTVYKVNVDQEKKLASVFQVRSIPMVLFIPKEGQPMKQVGSLPEAEYRRIIEEKLLE